MRRAVSAVGKLHLRGWSISLPSHENLSLVLLAVQTVDILLDLNTQTP